MKMKRKTLRVLLPVLSLALALCALTGCGEKQSGDGADDTPQKMLTQFEDLSGKTVSMLTGAPFEDLVLSKSPDVAEFTYYNSTPDMLLALKSGKTDAVLINNAIAVLAVNRNPSLALFPQNLQDGVFGFAFAKGDESRDEWQRAYDESPEQTKQALWEKWTGADESVKTLPEQDWPGLNGMVRAAVCDTLEPMSYAGPGGELIGFDLEMLLVMAKTLDVHVEFTGMEFSAILSSVQAGKADLGAGSIIVTAERRQSVDFVEYYPAAFVLIVRGEAAAETTLADLQNAPVGVLTGTCFAEIVEQHLPEADVLYFNSMSDQVNALKAGKVEAVALDEPVARTITAQNGDLTILPELLDQQEYAYALTKSERGRALCGELSEYIRALEADGTLEQLRNKWFDAADLSPVECEDYRDLPAVNGTVRMATYVYPPFVVDSGDRLTGYEIELIAMFCRDRGCALEIESVSNDALEGMETTGAVSITVTEERKETMLFSEPDYVGGTAMLVRKVGVEEEQKGFFESIADSFEKTFIREQRWKLFLEGTGTTLLITALAILLGTALGFAVYLLCRNGNAVANAITRVCVWLVQGMPMVVLLMILYYVIFGKVAIPGVIVSVIGFSLVFAAAVFGMLKSGVGAVDAGQTEAAYALGYSDRRAFFRIVLPQAVPHFFPAYKGEITATVKATAIVGYVAVQDLTKMGDIIRSRTYEAFFPLIAVAVIYFILAAVLTAVVNRLSLRIDPRRRKREDVLKGVDLK